MLLFSISIILFLTGILTIFWNRQNVIRLFIGTELCLLSANWNLIICMYYCSVPEVLPLILCILAIAAVEIAIGLGIIVLVFYKFGTIKLNNINQMNG